MKAIIDNDMCIGCGLCVTDCPDVFEMQGDKAVTKVSKITADKADACNTAITNCPTQAIKCE